MIYNKQKDSEIRLGGTVLKQVEKFKYLGSVSDARGGCDKDVDARVAQGWSKWRALTGVLCDRRMPNRLKGKIYKTVVRPAMLYGCECWALKKEHERKVAVAEMKMLRWTAGVTRKDKIRNEEIRARFRVRRIEQKLQERRLAWYGHVQRRGPDYVGRAAEAIKPETKRGRGRPPMTWEQRIKADLDEHGLKPEDTQNRELWKKLTRMADPG